MLQFVCFAVASITGGWAAQRFGISNRSLVIFGILGVGIILGLGAFLPNIQWFIAWAIPLGFLGGLVETFSSVMICKFNGPGSSKMLSLSQVFFCLGAIFAPFLVGRLLAADIAWPNAFLTLGGCIFAIGVFFTIMTRNLHEPRKLTASESENDPVTSQSIPMLRDPLFYCLFIGLFLYVSIEGSMVCWIAAYFEEFQKLSSSSAAGRLSIFWIGMVTGRTAILFLPSRWTLWPAVIVGAVGMTLATLLFCLRPSPITASVLTILCATAAGPLWPVIVTLGEKVRSSRTFTSCIISGGALGAALGPFLSSQVIRLWGMKALFPALTLCGLVLVSVLVLGRSRHRKEQRQKSTPVCTAKN